MFSVLGPHSVGGPREIKEKEKKRKGNHQVGLDNRAAAAVGDGVAAAVSTAVEAGESELPAATVGEVLLVGGRGEFRPARGGARESLLGSGSSSLIDDGGFVFFFVVASVSGTGDFFSSSSSPLPATVTVACCWPSRNATMTWPSVLVPIMRAWADGLSRGLSGDGDWQNWRMVAPSGV